MLSILKGSSSVLRHTLACSLSKTCVSNRRTMSVSAAQPPHFLYICGKGDKGQLGLGSSVTQALVPTLVKTEEPVVDVSCGRNFTVFVTSQGSVFTMGDNENGCVLGNSSVAKSSFEPVRVEGLDGVNIVKVAAGQKHTLALSDDGSVYSWGCARSSATSGPFGASLSSVGTLGHGDKESKARPERIEALQGVRVTHIACGGQHNAVLADDGSVYTWGLGEQGRLGHGTNDDAASPRRVEELPPAQRIACGEHFTAAVTRDGALFTWGKNKVGELGHEGLLGVFAQEASPKEIDRAEHLAGAAVVQIACGTQHALAITEGGRVYVWGSAGFSHHSPQRLRALSAPAWPAARRVELVAAGCAYSVAVCADGGALAWGRNRIMFEGGRWVGTTGVLGIAGAGAWEVEPKDVAGLAGVCHAACGTYHTAFLAAPPAPA